MREVRPTSDSAKVNQQYKKTKRETTVSQRLNTFVLLMYKHLTREQRYVIYLELQRGTSQEVIAQLIDVSKSTVSREIKRNSTMNGKYVWFKAHDKAEERKKCTPGNRGLSPLLRWRIEQLIKDEQWSPRQISGYLAKEGVKVSHEAIYAMIRNDKSGELAGNCRHKMKYKRTVHPHRVTITTDNGSEFTEHEWITKQLNIPIYFADSYCSWQKGGVENENKLIRQYIPKGTDISTITNGKIKKTQYKLNERPREKLNFLTPKECFYKVIS